MKSFFKILLCMILLFVPFLTLKASAEEKPSKPVIELYVMSMCPFGVQAENMFFDVLKTYGGSVDFTLGFIASKTEESGKLSFSSMHGQAEVDEDMRQICARDLAPAKWMDYVLERNKNYRVAEWEPAAKAVGLDPAAIEACVKGAGQKSFAVNIELGLKRSVNSSPTVYIDNQLYKGRTKEHFEWTICSTLKGKGGALPVSCEKVLAGSKPASGLAAGCEEPTPLNVKVVTEKDCKVCAPTLIANIKRLHASAKIVELDAASEEGKALIAKHGAKVLPLYILDKAIENEVSFKDNLDKFYSASAGEYTIAPVPMNYYPAVRLERSVEPGHLDVFVEALSVKAGQVAQDLQAFLAEKDKLPKDMSISWHLLTQEAPLTEAKGPVDAPSRSKKIDAGHEVKTKLISSRGPAELSESLLQACLFKYEPFSFFMTYLNCRYYAPNATNRSAQCYVPQAMVRECIDSGEGEEMLRADAKLAAEINARSGSLLWQNRYGPFPWDSIDWKALMRGDK